jgi:hypothetical protein
MYWLFWAYVERFKFWGMVMAAMFPPALISLPAGRYIAKLLDVDDQFIIGACFFALLIAEVYAYDRFNRWRFLRRYP